MAKGINNEDRKNFFNRFDSNLLSRIMSFRGGDTASRNYRANLDLDKKFIKKLKEFKKQNLTKTDVIEAGIVEFVYGDPRKNTLTVRGAIRIISKGDSVIANAANLTLCNPEQTPDFVDFIKKQCEDGQKEALVEIHGKDVIDSILNN
jgi:hypothetical protein